MRFFLLMLSNISVPQLLLFVYFAMAISIVSYKIISFPVPIFPSNIRLLILDFLTFYFFYKYLTPQTLTCRVQMFYILFLSRFDSCVSNKSNANHFGDEMRFGSPNILVTNILTYGKFVFES